MSPKGRGERILDGVCCTGATTPLGSIMLDGEAGLGLACPNGGGEALLDGACREEEAPTVGVTMSDGELGKGLIRLCWSFGGAWIFCGGGA